MKKTIIITAAVVVASLCASDANAQIFRRACVGGACYRSYSAYRSYAPAMTTAVTPCEAVGVCEEVAVAPCEPVAVQPCEPVQTVEEPAPEPCEPVATTCEGYNDHFRDVAEMVEVGECVGGTCPIRRVVKGTAQTAVNTVATVASTARFLVAVNAVRARYGLRPLQGDAYLDKGCATQAGVCAARSTLIHAPGHYEILAQNTSGFDAALNQWVASQGHAAILLNPSFKYAGVAVHKDASGRYWCAMRFR